MPVSDDSKPKRILKPHPQCKYCHGTGIMDSGGFTPWDEAIFIRCDCTYPRPYHEYAEEEFEQ